MPGKSGWDLLKDLKTNDAFAAIPIFISSTSATPATIARSMELGAAGYLVKPETFNNYDEFVQQLYQKVMQQEHG
jgi:two-component system chemotaxis response regulator CheY